MMNNVFVIAVVVIVVLVILATFAFNAYFGKKFNKLATNFIAKAQYGKLNASEAIVKVIEKFRGGTMDERMVLVIAEIIEKLPFVNLIYTVFPKKSVINFLYKKSQKVFDNVEDALKAHRRFGITEIEGIALKTFDPEDFNLSHEDLKKGFNTIADIAPELNRLKPLLDNADQIAELVKILNKEKQE